LLSRHQLSIAALSGWCVREVGQYCGSAKERECIEGGAMDQRKEWREFNNLQYFNDESNHKTIPQFFFFRPDKNLENRKQ